MILGVSYLLFERVISIFQIKQQTYTEIDLIRTLISANLGVDGINPHIRFDLVTVELEYHIFFSCCHITFVRGKFYKT